MKIKYFPETDSLMVILREPAEPGGDAMEIAPGITAHYDVAGALMGIEADGDASRLVDLSSIELEGLDLGGAVFTHHERRANV